MRIKYYNPLEELAKYQKQDDESDRDELTGMREIEINVNENSRILGYSSQVDKVQAVPHPESRIPKEEKIFVRPHEAYHSFAHYLPDTPTEQAEKNADAYASSRTGYHPRFFPN